MHVARLFWRFLWSGVFAATLSAPALAGVSVNFIDPDSYTDVRQFESKIRVGDRQKILDELEAYLESLGSELGPNQQVTLDVLNIDLAGQTEVLSARQQNERLGRDFTAPSMRVKYVFEEGGQVIASDEETISDQNYLNHPTLRTDTDPLRYEKYMLQKWFRQRFVKRGATMQ